MKNQRNKILSIIQSIPPNSTTRFAPSPTGYLHLGHVLSAIFVWSIARLSGSKVLLRIEDHDRQRSKKNYETAIVEDLLKLGFQSDNQNSPQWRQSDRQKRYQNVLNNLVEQKQVYACQCSRKDILLRLPESAHERELYYPGTCRSLHLDLYQPDSGIRLRLPEKNYHIDDLYQGRLSQKPASQCGDVLIRDRNKFWTYQFCCVVDDADQGINLIIRGQDLTSSAARQIQISEICGWVRPLVFVHHPLIHDPSGIKLSKRLQSLSIREMLKQGLKAEQIIGKAAFLGGLTAEEKPISLLKLIEGLSHERN